MLATRKITGAAIAASAVLAGAPWAFTQAVFSDTETVTGNTFTTQTIDLGLSATSALLSLTTMLPGDKVTAPLTISNSGSGALRYAMSSSATNAVLGAGLSGKIKTGVLACTNDGFGLTGTEVTSGAANTLGFGSSSQGAQTGDRSLAAAANETLCFQVELPISAENTLQGLSSTLTFTFNAEQTTNN